MNNDKCIFRENIFVNFTFSIDMFDIFKTIIATTRIIFQAINCRLLHQNYLFEDNTNDLRKKIILKSDQKIVQSNSFHKNEYNYFNKIQKAFTLLLLLKLILQREEQTALRKL
jgi:hypothetical protein